MFIGLKDDIKLCIDINGIEVQMTDNVKILGTTIDSMLNSNKHVQTTCKKLQISQSFFLELLQTLSTKKTLCYTIHLYRQISTTDLDV